MKRFLIVSICILLLLTACGGEKVTDTSVPTFQPAPSQPTEAPSQPTEAPTEPTEPATVKRQLVCEGKTYADFYELMETLWEAGRFEQEEHSLTIEGLSTPVTLYLHYDSLAAYSAWDYTFEVDPEDQCYAGLFGMNDTGNLVEYQGVPILNATSGGGDYTLILFEEGPWIRSTQDERSLVIYVDREDQLMAYEYSTKFSPSIDHWDTAPIDLAVSRDDFFDATGPCVIDGTDVQPMLGKARTISDVADLDAIFADAKADGRYPQFDTVDQLLEWNRANRYHPEGPDDHELWSREEHREDGSLRSRVDYYGDQKVRVQTYDEQGRLTLQGNYDCTGQSMDRRYTYDENGNCTGLAYYAWGQEQLRYTMTYDDQGRMIQRVRTRSGVPTGVQDYTYEKDGGWTETFSQNGQKKHTCRYDAEGTLIRHCTYQDGVTVQTQDVGSLVKAQQVLEVAIPPLDNSPIVYSFRYDGTGLIYSSASYGASQETSYDGSIHRPLDSTTRPEHEEVQLKTVYSYTDGIMTGEKCYEEGELIGSAVYTWEGDVQTEHHLTPEGIVGSVTVRTYEDGRLVSLEDDSYREVYDYSTDGRTVTITISQTGAQDMVIERHYDELGRIVAQEGRDYTYADASLDSIFVYSDRFPIGTVMIDYYEVWVSPETARDLTDTFNEALSWLA